MNTYAVWCIFKRPASNPSPWSSPKKGGFFLFPLLLNGFWRFSKWKWRFSYGGRAKVSGHNIPQKGLKKDISGGFLSLVGGLRIPYLDLKSYTCVCHPSPVFVIPALCFQSQPCVCHPSPVFPIPALCLSSQRRVSNPNAWIYNPTPMISHPSAWIYNPTPMISHPSAWI